MPPRKQDDGLAAEIAVSLAAGMRRVTVAELDRELADLGYRRGKDSRCTCTAQNMATGNHYPCTTYGVDEADTGMSAFNVDARRDANFKALQALRFNTFAVSQGRMVSV